MMGKIGENPRRSIDTERAVSELIGFVISFSMIVLAVGVLYIAGVGSLHDLQDAEQTENAEQVFLAISDGFQELQEGQAPKRAGSLDLDVGATLGVANKTVIGVSVNNASGTAFDTSVPVRALEYRHAGSTVAYESGAVVRADASGSVIAGRPPGIYCANDTNVAFVSLVQLVAPNDPSISGGTVTVTGIQRSTTLMFPKDRHTSTVQNVTISIQSPYESAWDQYLGTSDTDWVTTGSTGTFACEDATNAYVRVTVVEVQIVN